MFSQTIWISTQLTLQTTKLNIREYLYIYILQYTPWMACGTYIHSVGHRDGAANQTTEHICVAKKNGRHSNLVHPISLQWGWSVGSEGWDLTGVTKDKYSRSNCHGDLMEGKQYMMLLSKNIYNLYRWYNSQCIFVSHPCLTVSPVWFIPNQSWGWIQLSLLVYWYSVWKLSWRLWVTNRPATMSGAVIMVHTGIRGVPILWK